MISKITLGLAAALFASSAFAHGDDNPDLGKGLKPPPFAVLQLDEVRNATARFIDVAQAEKEGYHDIGLFVPHMGWHYMKDRFVDGRFVVELHHLRAGGHGAQMLERDAFAGSQTRDALAVALSGFGEIGRLACRTG